VSFVTQAYANLGHITQRICPIQAPQTISSTLLAISQTLEAHFSQDLIHCLNAIEVVSHASLAQTQASLADITACFLASFNHIFATQAHPATSQASITRAVAISQVFQLVNISAKCFIISTHFSHNISSIAKEGFSFTNSCIFISPCALVTSSLEFISALYFK
jgi:hypothetical protein